MGGDLAAWPADHVERRPISTLVPYARNARTHSEAQVAQLAASLRQWGWTMPVLIDEQGTIIAGHGRVLAARQLGWKEAPVMIARGWTDAAKRAYTLADNKLALNADWTSDMLAIEIDELRGAGFDVNLIGFADHELAVLAEGWNPDFATVESHTPHTDGVRRTLRVTCEPEDYEGVRALITDAIEGSSLEHVTIE
jgi:ParB-like chromosome segregation protein Spo0J